MLGAVDLTVFDQARKLVAAAHEDAIVDGKIICKKTPPSATAKVQGPNCRQRVVVSGNSQKFLLPRHRRAMAVFACPEGCLDAR